MNKTDRALLELRLLGEKKGIYLYNILIRDMGIGFQYWEEARSGMKIEELGGDILSNWDSLGLVVYKYYSSLSEGIRGEWIRLGGDPAFFEEEEAKAE